VLPVKQSAKMSKKFIKNNTQTLGKFSAIPVEKQLAKI